MANKKITELTELTAPAGADILAIVDDVAGTATTKKVSVTNLMGQASASNLSSYDFNGNAISNFDASINDQTGTTYTVAASDNGKVVVLDNASAVTVTIPGGLGAGFNCSFVQKGAGRVTFAESLCDVNNRQGHTKINGQYGVASIVAYASDFFVLAGDTAS
jgi:hypothetical protein